MARNASVRAPAAGAAWKLPRFWPVLVLALLVMAVFRVIDVPLQTAAALQGIVSYELAGTVEAAQAMLDSWDGRARLYTAFGLGLDYLFMPSYALAIGLACAWAARRLGVRWRPLGGLGLALAWGQAPAVLLDATENFALTKMLLAGTAAAPWPAVSAACATVKFALVILGLVYTLAGALSWLTDRLRSR